MLLTNEFNPDPRVYNEAKALVESGFRVTIMGWDRDLAKPKTEIIDGIKVQRIYVRSTHGRGISQIFFLILFWIITLFKLVNAEFDFVHCHDFDTLPLGFFIGKIKKKKIIFDAHENYTDMLSNNLNKHFRKFILFCENLLIKRVDLLITVGELLKSEYQKRGAKIVVVVGNWKDIDSYNFSKQIINENKKELNIPIGKLVIAFISHLGKERKIEELLNYVSLNENVFLLLGGDGPLQKYIERNIIGKNNIRFLGFVNPHKVPLYTCLSDIIFYGFDENNPNSKYSSPNKLFEALAAGKIVITGNFGEIAKIVKEENCGIVMTDYSYSSFENTINKLLINNNYLSFLSQNSKNAAKEKYNWDKAKSILINEYQKLQLILSLVITMVA